MSFQILWRRRRVRIVAANLAIYIFWGSAYLAMRIGLESLPPLVLAGTRLIAAGGLMLGIAALQGHFPRARHLAAAAIAGTLLFLGGHGLLYWGEQRLSSGLTAVLFASIPLWVVLLEAIGPARTRLGPRTIIGLLLGMLGVLSLVGPARLLGAGKVDTAGAVAVVGASFCWAVGSIYCTRTRGLPEWGFVAGGLEMLTGGCLLVMAAGAMGEWSGFQFAAVSTRSLWAWGFLIGCSSLIGFSCYLWLLGESGAASVSTYAYVNPIVAVLIGWAWAGEAITRRTIAASAMLLAAVVLIVGAQSRRGDTRLLRAEVDPQGAAV